jgi:GWxTD domain-containing protein
MTLAAAMAAWQSTPPPAAQAVPPAAQVAPAAQAVPVPLMAQARQVPPPGQEANPYHLWLTQDVAYIITDAERAAFKALQSDPEREHFIEQFWLRRDPTPGTPQNEFKEEIYRRIQYANDHYASAIPGWKTDRGRIYITYGPPDEKESHPSGDAAKPYPYEQWLYHYIEGIGKNVIIEFDDPNRNGEFRMTMDPSAKDADAPPAAAQRFYVQGEVAHPGAFRLLTPTRVLGALVAAGGFKDSAGPRQIVIMHVTGEAVPFNYEEVVQGRNTNQNIFLQSGDIIIVK